MRWPSLLLFLSAIGLAFWVIAGLRLAASAGPVPNPSTKLADQAGMDVVDSTPFQSANHVRSVTAEPVLRSDPLATETEVFVQTSPNLVVDQPVDEGESSTPVRSDVIQKVIVPKLRLNVQVIEAPYVEMTWDLTGLGQQVAWLRRPSTDGPDKNLVLAGHATVFNGSNGPFRYLSRLKPSDEVLVYTSDQILTYQIRESIKIYPEDVSVIEDTSKPQLTLVTCIDWNDNTKTYLRRLVVFGDLVKVASTPGKPED